MRSILVVDDMTLVREPIAASLRLAGYQAICACDGEEALRITRVQRPDLILLDFEMPKMDGITFLKHLRADPTIARTPVMLLTGHSERKDVLAAAPYGVKEYILKSRFGLKDLLERIKKLDAAVPVAGAAAPQPPSRAIQGDAQPTDPKPSAASIAAATDAGDLPQLLTREEFLKRVQGVLQGKTLSGIVAQVISMASSPRSDTTQLAGLIARDTMLSVRVLQIANSASYSAGAPVTTIADAIRKVGCNTVRNIAAALGVFDCLPDGGTDGFNPIRCWQHSFAVAQVCEKLASVNLEDQAGLAYVVGLCHDLGDIFIRTQFGKEYQQVTETAKRTGRSREQLNAPMLGMTSAQMINVVLKAMGLPDAIREPIEILHSSSRSRTKDPIARILWMAENYTNAVMLGSGLNSEVAPLTQSSCRAAVGEPNPPRPDSQNLRAQILALVLMLGKLSRQDEAKLIAPMFNQSRARIWIARDPGISQFDPIALALEPMATSAVHDSLPTEAQTSEIDGLVVVASTVNSTGFGERDIDRALAKPRAAGQTLPVLAITADAPRETQQAGPVTWRPLLELSDLMAFVEALSTAQPLKAAA